MKYGILTFHNVTNYGAVLQCYALQNVIREMGYDIDVIDYQNQHFKKYYSPFFLEKRNLRKFAYMLYIMPVKIIRNYRFKKFRNQYLGLSKNKYDHTNIAETTEVYHKIITGSDQVWNMLLTAQDDNYLLGFLPPDKRMSYAASLGFESVPKELEKTYIEEISKFRKISVREQRASEIIEDLLGRAAEVHIDPVFLLTKQQWEKIVKKEHKEKYICVYKINKSNCYKIAKKLKEKTGYKVIVLQPGMRCPGGFIKKWCASPDEFVELILNAQYVVTDSFHGTSFSMLLHKDFFVSLDSRKDNRNSRITGLLNKFDLQDRIVNDIDYERAYSEKINYIAVENKFEDLREKSRRYLQDGLDNKN